MKVSETSGRSLSFIRIANVFLSIALLLSVASPADLVAQVSQSVPESIFPRTLSIGSRGADVYRLQLFLNKEGFVVALSGPGSYGRETNYFGVATQRAVIRFQERYRSEILLPAGLARGNGVWGPFSRRKAHRIIVEKRIVLPGIVIPPVESRISPPVDAGVRTQDLVVFVSSLIPGSQSEDVRRLQIFLNSEGFLIAASGPGSPGQETEYFGESTRRALTSFQEVHRRDILEPVGLERGTGIFGPLTRVRVNAIIELRLTASRQIVSGGTQPGSGILSGGVSPPSTVTSIPSTSVVLIAGKAGRGSGRVIAIPLGIDCGESCVSKVISGSDVELTAAPNISSVFVRWENCSSPQGDRCRLTARSDTTVTAVFDLISNTFALNARVRVRAGVSLNVRQTPSINAPSLGVLPPASRGSVIAGPTTSDGEIWWKIDYDSVSVDGWSGERYLEALDVTAPTAVSNFSVEALSQSAVRLSWSPSSDDRSTLLRYRISRNGVGLSFVNTFSFIDTGVAVGTNYTYSVSTIDDEGNESAAVSLTIRTTEIRQALPPPTANLIVSPASISGAETIMLRWSSTNATSCTGAAFSTNSSPSGAVSTLLATTTTFTLTCSGDGGITSASATVTLNQPATHSLTVIRVGEAGSLSAVGLTCEVARCSWLFTRGSQVVIRAIPQDVNTAVSWQGCVASGNNCTLTMMADIEVTATFAIIPPARYAVEVRRVGGGVGSVGGPGISCDAVGSDCAESVTSGTTITLTATPSSLSTFTGWSGGGCSGTGGCTVTVTAPVVVTASFESQPLEKDDKVVRLTVLKAGSGSGTVTALGLSCEVEPCTGTYTLGSTVVITAVPNQSFVSWQGGNCTTIHFTTCTVTLNQDTIITATFLTLTRTDTTPPSRTSLTAATFPSTTTSVNLSLSTNENATCRWGNVSNVSYGSIPNTFTTTGSTRHSQTLTNLGAGTHTYVVRCRDTSGNENFDDLVVSFTIEAPAIITVALSFATPAIFPGRVSLFDSKDLTVVVKYAGDGRPASSVALQGLAPPYSFKGGSYPGVGGTCGQTITSDCTLVLSFTPRLTGGVPWGGELRYDREVKLIYEDGTLPRESGVLRILLGLSPLVAKVSIGAGRDGGLDFGTSLVGAYVGAGYSGSASLYIGNNGGEIRDISAFLPEPPFYALRQSCGATLVSPSSCGFTFKYAPTAVGRHEQLLTVRYNDGFAVQTKTVKISGRAFIPSPTQNVLIVYNRASQESVDIKNYYLANRLGMEGVNVLDISYATPLGCSSSACDQNPEFIDRATFESSILEPIRSWIASRPEKDIRYIILMHGIPTSVGYPGNIREASLDDLLSQGITLSDERYPGTAPSITHMAMGSVAATKAYIDKLKDMYNRMPFKRAILSAEGTGTSGRTYYLEDVGSPYGITGFKGFANSVSEANPNASLDYRSPTSTYITRAQDVLGFTTWGWNSRRSGDYANDGNITFTGNSGWYIIKTLESYNGQRVTWQGNFEDWFRSNAFGSTNYEFTPVGAVAHVEEPVGGTNNALYFKFWEQGQLFIDAAWKSRGLRFNITIGDPLVTR